MQARDMSDPPSSSLKWRPSDAHVQTTQLYRFMREAEKLSSKTFKDYLSLQRWSVEEKEKFWPLVWDFCGVIGDRGREVYRAGENLQSGRFFADSKINFAENLLRRRDDAVALVFRGENRVVRQMSWRELYDRVSQVQQALQAAGVTSGDRVAGYLPNMPETIIAMLATASLGAVWSSASPDFGVEGVLDRFSQIEPKVLFAVDGYYYSGKEVDCRDKVSQVAARLPSLVKRVIVPYLGLDIAGLKAESLDGFCGGFTPRDITFARFDFNAPLYIMFSSGTTGVPKCITHGAGGTLLQHLKEHRLHCDIRENDRVFYFTTCGWMMWNWLVSALASGATLLLYDGSPFHPGASALLNFTSENGCTLFGASAKYIDALKSLRVTGGNFNFSNLRTVTSTGSPLAPESFDYVYDTLFPGVHLASISGGTDIVSCFVLGNPISPVYRGEIQGAGLGMDVDVFDENGVSTKSGKGELVCKSAFPAMPIGFWNDADGSKYRKAYFEKFPGIWCHGDWCEWTAHGGLIIHGRSDATLNPGGVRIGTAEIYRLVEQLDEVKESIVVGQDWKGDVRVILFVVLAEGATLDDALTTKIKKLLRDGASPRHVPAKIIAVADIPRTKSGKITEIAVRDTIHGRAVKNTEALANPEALKLYENLPELTP